MGGKFKYYMFYLWVVSKKFTKLRCGCGLLNAAGAGACFRLRLCGGLRRLLQRGPGGFSAVASWAGPDNCSFLFK